MNPFIEQLVINNVLHRKKKTRPHKKVYSKYRLAKGYRTLRINIIRFLKDSVLMVLGIFCAAFGLESFLMPNGFIDGGATGISLLLAIKTSIPLYALLLIINIPFIYLAYKVINKQFAIKSAITISGLALCLVTVHFPDVTHDKLLVAIFGGFFLGAGIGLSVRGGAVIDGTEVLGIYLSKKFSTTIGDVIIILNIVIFSFAAYFLNPEVALYSMITYLAASRTLDFVVEGIEEYMGVTIVSAHHEEIRERIIHGLGRGVTIYKGKRGFGKEGNTIEVDIIYTVITRLELNRLNSEIDRIDPIAFVVMSSVKDTRGGMIKKRAHKH